MRIDRRAPKPGNFSNCCPWKYQKKSYYERIYQNIIRRYVLPYHFLSTILIGFSCVRMRVFMRNFQQGQRVLLTVKSTGTQRIINESTSTKCWNWTNYIYAMIISLSKDLFSTNSTSLCNSLCYTKNSLRLPLWKKKEIQGSKLNVKLFFLCFYVCCVTGPSFISGFIFLNFFLRHNDIKSLGSTFTVKILVTSCYIYCY